MSIAKDDNHYTHDTYCQEKYSIIVFCEKLQGVEVKYGIIFKSFFLSWKKRGKSKFSWLALLFKHFF